MKFGKQFSNKQILEWSIHYIDYKELKQTIKSIKRENLSLQLRHIGFHKELGLETIKVETFLKKGINEISSNFDHLVKSISNHISPDNLILAAETHLNTWKILDSLKLLEQLINKYKTFLELNLEAIHKIKKKAKKRLSIQIEDDNILKFLYSNPFSEIEDIVHCKVEEISLGKLKDVTFDFGDNIEVPGSEILKNIKNSIFSDDAEKMFNSVSDINNRTTIQTIFDLCLNRNSIKCLDMLIKKFIWLLEYNDINGRNVLHGIVLLGFSGNIFTSSLMKSHKNFNTWKDITLLPSKDNDISESTLESENKKASKNKILKIVLEKMYDKKLYSKLIEKDIFGRSVFHYAIFSTLIDELETLLYYLKKFNLKEDLLKKSWEDSDGCSPLFYSVINNFYFGTKTVLRNFVHEMNTDILKIENTSKLLYHATYINSPEILEELIKYGADPNKFYDNGESVLHTCARLNRTSCVSTLIKLNKNNSTKIDFNLPNHRSKMTPLMVSSMEGNAKVADLLISNGADKTILDSNGWSAFSHAIYNGYIKLSEILEIPKQNHEGFKSKEPLSNFKSKPTNSPKHYFRLNLTLGSHNIKKLKFPIRFNDQYKNITDYILNFQGLNVTVSNNKSAKVFTLDLPIANLTILDYYVPDVNDLFLTFKIASRTFPKDIIACAVYKVTFDKKESLSNSSYFSDVILPLVEPKDFSVIGEMFINYSIITPFDESKFSLRDQHWPFDSTQVIGHRGFGANKKIENKNILQIGENTLLSFNAASSFGLNYVEFGFMF